MIRREVVLFLGLIILISSCTNVFYKEEIITEGVVETVTQAVEQPVFELPKICVDRDLDGYGVGKDCLGMDCNDNNKNINLGAKEVCGDKKDNDCRNGDEVCSDLSQDTDHDKLTDVEEIKFGTKIDNRDSDEDGLSDHEEITNFNTDPLLYDSDEDGFCDGGEVHSSKTDPKDTFSYPIEDEDKDGLYDGWEIEALSTPTRQRGLAFSAHEDMDLATDGYRNPKGSTRGDGLTNLQEFCLGTNPLDGDSDNDRLSDGEEWYETLTDPLNADTDGDGFKDGLELNVEGTNPFDANSYPIYTETRNLNRATDIHGQLGGYRKTGNWLGQPLR